METTLKEFAESFDTNVETLQILMAYDACFYQQTENAITTKNGNTVLLPIGVDRLETIMNEAASLKIPLSIVSDVTKVSKQRLLELIEADTTKQFSRMIIKTPQSDETCDKTTDTEVYIRFKALNGLLELAKKEAKTEHKKQVVKKKPRAKKSNYSINQKYVDANWSMDNADVKTLRQFLLGSGCKKPEEIAILSDQEILDAFKNDFVVIKTKEKGTILILKSALTKMLSDIYVIE